MALAVPLSRFTSLVGGGSAFFVRRLTHIYEKVRQTKMESGSCYRSRTIRRAVWFTLGDSGWDSRHVRSLAICRSHTFEDAFAWDDGRFVHLLWSGFWLSPR